jgi:hypothetical protein
MKITDNQQFDVTLQPVDKKGSPASIDGVPVYATSNAAVATVEASADGMSATIKGALPGTATISVSADADLGTGDTEIGGSIDVEVTSGAAIQANLTAGPVTEQQ